jgi:hypothetical protein
VIPTDSLAIHPHKHSTPSVLLTRLYLPSGDLVRPAYAASTRHWVTRSQRD